LFVIKTIICNYNRHKWQLFTTIICHLQPNPFNHELWHKWKWGDSRQCFSVPWMPLFENLQWYLVMMLSSVIIFDGNFGFLKLRNFTAFVILPRQFGSVVRLWHGCFSAWKGLRVDLYVGFFWVIAANMVGTEDSLSGTHLLCAVGRYQEACSQVNQFSLVLFIAMPSNLWVEEWDWKCVRELQCDQDNRYLVHGMFLQHFDLRSAQ
jgi:hypothetical protein